MRKGLLVAAILLVIGSALAFAAKVDLANYPSYDAAKAGIDKQVKAGWIPVGVDAFDEGKHKGIWVMYVDSFPLSKLKGDWDFLEYSDNDSLEADLSLAVKKGFTPIDYAEDSENTYVLYLKTSLPMKDWDLKKVGDAVKEIDANGAEELSSGWVPLGVHQDADGVDSLLYVQFKSVGAVKSVDCVRYTDWADLESDVQANAGKGWTPVGFTTDDSGNEITVIFIK